MTLFRSIRESNFRSLRINIYHRIVVVVLALFIFSVNDVNANGCTGSTFDMVFSPACGCWQVCGNYISDCDRVISLDFNFGDGTTASGSNPCHTYSAPGTYTVTMTVRAKCHGGPFGIGSNRTCNITRTVTVDPNQQTGISAAFSSDTLCYGNVRFTDESTNASTWLWDFGDGTTSTLQNPTHSYTTCGTFPVTLTVSDNTCCPTTITDNLTVPVLVNCLPIDIDTVCLGATTSFVPDISGAGAQIDSWNWQFSDGGIDSVQNPTHTFTDCSSQPGDNSVTLTITTTSGCNDVLTYPVWVYCGPDSIIANVDSVLCFGNSDGSINVSATGGVPGYTYQWNTGQSGPSLNSLVEGSYTVTATDAENCTLERTIDVLEPDLFEGVITVTDITCYGWTSGSALLTATGGTAPFSYVWSDGQTTSGPPFSEIINVPAGPYSVTATDENGCSFVESGTISQNPEIDASFTTVLATCGACDGSATVTGLGGSGGPYLYQWDNDAGNQTTATATGLCAGNYTVLVEDANVPTCSKIFSVNVNNVGAEAITASGTDVSCAGNCDGTATATLPSGCTNPPCAYTWYDSLGAFLGVSTANANNLCAGMHSVEVINGLGCLSFATVDISQPPLLTTSTTVVEETCSGDCDGQATVTTGGGSPPFTYQWYDGNGAAIAGATSASANSLCPGDYSVSITDANGCVNTETALIIGRSFSLSTTARPISCNAACDGSIEGVAVGGAAPLSYQWLDGNGTPIAGQTARSIFDLCGGTFTLQVTDANGCVLSNTINMVEPGPLTLAASATDILCVPGCSSVGTATVTGGTTPYTFVWMDTSITPLAGSNSTINNLCAGDYTVEVTDANGCTLPPAPFTVNRFFITVDDSVTDVSCPGGTDGSIDLTPSGGTPPYTFNWSTGVGSEDLNGLAAGNYSVTVANANSCTVALNFTVGTPPPLTISVDARIYSGGYNLPCPQTNEGIAVVTVTGGVGPYTYLWDANAQNQVEDTATLLTAGSYSVTATDVNGCTISGSVSLNEPPPVQLSSTFTNPACFGDSTGTVRLTGSGGVPPYEYFWEVDTGFLQIQDRFDLPAGTYTIIMFDDNVCDAYDTITIIEHPELVAPETHVDASCSQSADGSIDVSPGGGVPPYQFDWSTGDNTEDITGLAAGNYGFTLTDDSSCVVSLSIDITEPPAIPDTTVQVTICDNDSVLVSGVYQNTNGLYVDSLTTADGCDSVVYIDLTVNPTSSDTLPPVNICEGESHFAGGALQTQSGIYEDVYQNQFDCDSVIVTILNVAPTIAGVNDIIICEGDSFFVAGAWQSSSGTYLDSFLNVNNCDSIIQTNLEVSTIEVTGGNELICPGEVAVLEADSGYTYSWSPGGQTSQTIYVGDGDYNLTATNQDGCTDTAFYTVFQPGPIGLFATPDSVALLNDDSITVSVQGNGGVNIQSYVWSPDDEMFCLDLSTCDEAILFPQWDTRYLIVAEDEYGCFDSTYIFVDVLVDSGVTMLYVPNAFSPNGDGVNDVFNVEIFGEVSMKLQIFDRWGELLFETDDPNQGWDGIYKGELERPGVYVYHITAFFENNNIPENYPRDRTGSVTLIR